MRRTASPSTYRCPLCGELLPALSEHMLLFPEGDHSRRRHAHTACVMKARAEGRLPTREEWERTQPGAAAAAESLAETAAVSLDTSRSAQKDACL